VSIFDPLDDPVDESVRRIMRNFGCYGNAVEIEVRRAIKPLTKRIKELERELDERPYPDAESLPGV
jgi:hypothetical protein